MRRRQVLLVSGSLRRRSTNTALLRTAQLVAPDQIMTVLYDGADGLPPFDPDRDRLPLPPPVAELRTTIRAADAILFCTPEYAGGLPGSFKNLLDWTIGDDQPGSIYEKPVAWVNASAAPTGAADAHDSLRKVLGYAHAAVVTDACAALPVARHMVGEDGLISDRTIRSEVRRVLTTLITPTANSKSEGGAPLEGGRPWEPPWTGTEAEHVVGALERLRTTFRWKADDLGSAGLQTRIGSSALTLGGLLKHLAAAEDFMFTTKLTGQAIGAPWDATGWGGLNGPVLENGHLSPALFTSAASDTPAQLYAFWDGAVQRSRARLGAALGRGGLDQLVHLRGPGDRAVSLRRLLFDLIEEYGRHTGHADLLREAVDGRVGEDPPAGWHARSGSRSGRGWSNG